MKKRIIAGVSLTLVFGLIAGVLLPVLRPGYDGVNFNASDENNKTDKVIKFNSEGKLKILHITDTHLNLDHKHNFDPTIWLIENACDKEKPDIVMLTGDTAAVAAGSIEIIHTGFLIHQNVGGRAGKSAAVGIHLDKALFLLLGHYFFTPSTRPLAKPTRPCISEGMMILVA